MKRILILALIVVGAVVYAQRAAETVPQLPEGYSFGGHSALVVINDLCDDLCVAGATPTARLVIRKINVRYLAGNIAAVSREEEAVAIKRDRLRTAEEDLSNLGGPSAPVIEVTR